MGGADRLWTHEETAKWLHISIWTFHHLVTNGEGPPSYRVGRRARRYDPAEVREWLRANRFEPLANPANPSGPANSSSSASSSSSVSPAGEVAGRAGSVTDFDAKRGGAARPKGLPASSHHFEEESR